MQFWAEENCYTEFHPMSMNHVVHFNYNIPFYLYQWGNAAGAIFHTDNFRGFIFSVRFVHSILLTASSIKTLRVIWEGGKGCVYSYPQICHFNSKCICCDFVFVYNHLSYYVWDITFGPPEKPWSLICCMIRSSVRIIIQSG